MDLVSLCKCTPRSSGYSSFEILYGRPPPVIQKPKGDHQHLVDLEMSQHLQALGKVFCHIAQETWKRTPIPLGNWVHPYEPGDEIWVKDWKKEPLLPVWTGPHMVILATPTTVRVIGVIPWIHHTRVKKAATSCDEDIWKAVRTLKTSSKSGSKDNSSHPWRTLSPALVAPEAD